MEKLGTSRTDRGCARNNPGTTIAHRHFVRAVTDGRDNYRYVFQFDPMTFVVLKQNVVKGYQSVKIWSTTDMNRTYDSWKTKIPVEPSESEIDEAFEIIVLTCFRFCQMVEDDIDE